MCTVALCAEQQQGRVRVVVAEDGSTFSIDDETVDIRGRGTLRRILVALASNHAHRGTPLDVPGLFAAGWPGDRVQPSSVTARVHTALWTLRRLGLRSVLVREPAGYRFRPDVVIELATG